MVRNPIFKSLFVIPISQLSGSVKLLKTSTKTSESLSIDYFIQNQSYCFFYSFVYAQSFYADKAKIFKETETKNPFKVKLALYAGHPH